LPENQEVVVKKKRGRPPKNKDQGAVSETNKQNVVEKTSKQSETNEFCSYSSSYAWSNYYFGMNIFDIISKESLLRIIRDPIANNEEIREISLMLYGTNGIFSNTTDYMTSMPTLDKVIVTHGTSSTKKKKNKEKTLSVLKMIKDREIMRDGLFRGMIEGVAFYYFETNERPDFGATTLSDYDVTSISEINESGMNASVISLPAKFTQIVGIKNSSYVIAFDLKYFDNFDGETTARKLRKYPKEIRNAYNIHISGGTGNNWVVLDNTKTIVHKIKSKREEKWGRPIVLTAINNIIYADYFQDTKRNVLDEMNNKIIYQTFPGSKDRDGSSLTKNQQRQQHDDVKNAVMNKNNKGGTNFFSVAAGTKLDTIDCINTDIFDDKYESSMNEKISMDLGTDGGLLGAEGSGSYSNQVNNLALLSSQVFQWIEQIENELNKCINENIIKDPKNYVECKYLPITHVNKKEMAGYAKELYLQGKGSLSLWASCCGISPDVYFALLDSELEEDIENKYPIHKTSYTLSKEDNTGGRPETDNPTDNTIKSQNSNGNAIPSPSDN